MDYFDNKLSPENRYKNESLNHLRKQTELLKEILDSVKGGKEHANTGTTVKNTGQPNGNKRGTRSKSKPKTKA